MLDMIPEYAQRKIARTNGRLWRSRVGRLTELPIPEIPIPPGDGGLLLDIGCGWGRWTAAAARRGYVPVGIDIQLDAARATLQTLRSLGLPGYVVVADLQHLPFAPDVFSAVWSFSVLQHAHRKYVASCLDGIQRSLKPRGFVELEFPTRWGLRNMLARAFRRVDEDELDSWCVRYYALSELRALMQSRFEQYDYRAHCFFGTGILPDDLRHVPTRFAPLILASTALTVMTRAIRPLKRLADSVYVRGVKNPSPCRAETVSIPASHPRC
jgi:SAM-dependent methyltransferase